jgi:hypothetical protein
MWEAADFRALARSSPWLWRSVRLVHAGEGTVPVRAWVRRPHDLRVETLDGHLLAASSGPSHPTDVALFQVWDATVAEDPGVAPPLVVWWTDARAPIPARRPDGLVDAALALPPHVVVDDPMWQDYRWVAMLNPRELADASDGAAAVDVDALAVVQRHDRPTLVATVRPHDGYDPRCSCCPLLPSRPAALAEGYPDPDGSFAEAHEVALDVATGICVAAREVGGPHDGRGFAVTIEAVDEDLHDGLFTEPAPSAGRLRRLLARSGPARPGRWSPYPD